MPRVSISICKSSKLTTYSLLKSISKVPISDVNKRGLFTDFALNRKGCHFSITRFEIPIFCNILNLEINFRNFYKKMIVYFIKFLTKASLKQT